MRSNQFPEILVNFRGDFRSGCLASAYGPDRLVRKQNTREVSRGQRMQAALKLTFQDGFGVVGLAFRQAFAHTDDRSQVRGKRSFDPAVHRGVGFREILAALGMSDDYGAAASV